MDTLYRHEWRAMGVWCRVASTQPLATDLLEERVEAWEQVLSRFRPQSELMQLNRVRQMRVSHTLHQVILASMTMARWSGGLVVPSVGQTMVDLGYRRTFAELADVPENDDFLAASTLPAWQDIRVRGRDVTLPAQLMLDVAGVAKGWVAEQLVAELSQHGAAVLAEIGGDIAVRVPATGTPWAVTVEHPFQGDAPLATVVLQHGAVATSSVLKRHWYRAGQRMHHIIDPRTNMPAASDVATATVIASEGVVAETAAKVVVVLGMTAGRAWLDDQQLPGVIVGRDGSVLPSQRWPEFVWTSPTNQQ